MYTPPSKELQSGARLLSRHPIKTDTEFRMVAQDGVWINSRLMSVGFLSSEHPEACFGLRVQKRIARATDRNRIKRRLRFLFYSKRIEPVEPGNYVVVFRGPLASALHLEKELVSLLSRHKKKR